MRQNQLSNFLNYKFHISFIVNPIRIWEIGAMIVFLGILGGLTAKSYSSAIEQYHIKQIQRNSDTAEVGENRLKLENSDINFTYAQTLSYSLFSGPEFLKKCENDKFKFLNVATIKNKDVNIKTHVTHLTIPVIKNLQCSGFSYNTNQELIYNQKPVRFIIKQFQ